MGMTTEAAPAWASYLPLAILALVMLLRLRNLNKARRLRTATLLILPLIYGALVVVILWAMPPSWQGWLCFVGGMAIGALVGWQRGRLMRLHIDEASGAVMVRQSPAALVLLVAILLLRRAIMPATGFMPSDDGNDLPPEALYATDALIGFALAMIIAQRAILWRRARTLIADALRSTASGAGNAGDTFQAK